MVARNGDTGRQENSRSILFHSVSWIINKIRFLWRTVWVSRIGVASVLLGFAMLWYAPQSQDLFAELKRSPAIGGRYWLTFYLMVLLLWSLPVFFSSKLAIKHFEIINPVDRPLGSFWPRTIPYILSLCCLVALFAGQIRALSNLHLISQDSDSVLSMIYAFFLQAGLIIDELLSGDFFRRTISIDDLSLRHMVILPLETIIVFFIFIAVLNLLSRLKNFDKIFLTYGFILTALAIVVIFVDPIVSTKFIHRALLIPVVLGCWVPFFSYLSHISHRIGVSLILFLLIFVGISSIIFDNKHDVRYSAEVTTIKRLSLDEAIDSWTTANGCSVPDISNCPNPIIVAAAGGASRAAFFTASVLGDILDKTLHNSEYRDFGKQLFAISAVSGGSLGAASFLAALKHHEEKNEKLTYDSSRSPCRDIDTINREKKIDISLWHAFLEIDLEKRFRNYHSKWKDCMQFILSGDFISPVFLSLAFSDLLQIGIYGDRAVSLERAWEKRYRGVVGSPDLQRAFTSLAPEKDRWRPILILNGTSAETGRRIIISSIKPSYGSSANSIGSQIKFRVFHDAFDFYELMNSGLEHGAKKRDIPVSTAVALSARFPIISPEANVKNAKEDLIDFVVDGGYFENFGAITALELAERLTERGLKPVILQITNDPEIANLNCATRADEWESPPPASQYRPSQLFQSFRAPIRGLFHTRSARGSHAIIRLCNWLWRQEEADEVNETTFRATIPFKARPNRFAHVRIYPAPKYQLAQGQSTEHDFSESPGNRTGAFKQLSMSWWLSKSIQRYLDIQLPGAAIETQNSDDKPKKFVIEAQERNRGEIQKILDVLRRNN